MKQTTILLLAGAIGLANGAPGTKDLEDTARFLRQVQNKVSEMRTNVIEKSVEEVTRSLQRRNWNSRVNDVLFDLCKDETPSNEDFTQGNFGAFDDFVQCLTNTFNSLFVDCLTGLPSLGSTAECFLELSTEDGDNTDPSVLATDSLGGLDFTRGFRSSRINDNYRRCGDITDKGEEVDEDTCTDLFGDSNNTDSFACFQLLFDAQLDNLHDFLENEVNNSASCTNFSLLVGQEGAESFVEGFFLDQFDFFNGVSIRSSDQGFFDQTFEDFEEVFNNCSDIDDGVLLSSLQARFGTGSTTATESGVGTLNAMSALLASIFAYVVTQVL